MAGKNRHLFAVFLSIFLIGTIGYNMRIIGDSIPVVSVLFSRLFIGALLAAIVVPFFDDDVFRVSKKDLFHYALIGVLMATTFGFFLWALSLAPVANVTLITSTSVIFTGIFSHLFLKKGFSFHLIISFIIAIIGLFIMNTFRAGFFYGSLVALIQAVMYGTLIGATRLVGKHKNVGAVFWFLVFASLFTFPLAIWKGFGDFEIHLQEILMIGVLGTGFSYMLFLYGVRKVQANVAAMVSLIFLPLSSILFAALFISEIPDSRTLLGGTILLAAGVYLIWNRELKRWYYHINA